MLDKLCLWYARLTPVDKIFLVIFFSLGSITLLSLIMIIIL